MLLLATMDQRIAVSASPESVDKRIARLAAAQHGVFSRADAAGAGASRGLIESRWKSGRWEPLYPAVYRLAGTPDSWRQRLLAACLSVGPNAVASHRSAAAVSQLPGGDGRLLEISVPRGRRVRRDGLDVREVRSLVESDVMVSDAIPVTTPTRTLIDLAAVLSADILEEALDDALRRRLTTLRRLRWRLDALGSRGRAGTGVLAELIEARSGGQARSESVLETRFLRLLRQRGLPLPVCQHEVREGDRVLARVDFAYPAARLAVEVDGYRWHSGRARWEHDLDRRNALTARGWRIIHVTWSDLERRPDLVIRTIAAVLGKG
jgi:very-short-patch-repair endonuclease